MPFWRRKPLHEQLAEEGGLTLREPESRAPWDAAGVHGVARPRQWDAVVAVESEAPGDELTFVALADGTLLVDDEVPGLDAFADALEGLVTPPYRCLAIRRGEGRWAAAANGIDVVELESDPDGDAVELSVHGGGRELVVDGMRLFGSHAELERLLEGGDGVVRAQRLDGALWEVTVSPL